VFKSDLLLPSQFFFSEDAGLFSLLLPTATEWTFFLGPPPLPPYNKAILLVSQRRCRPRGLPLSATISSVLGLRTLLKDVINVICFRLSFFDPCHTVFCLPSTDKAAFYDNLFLLYVFLFRCECARL